ncbi:iron-containing redox enzyme family protein [Marinobacterium sp. D7]|uniref:TenA family transcriptional regulator n=1 Tax=Marinobacterium ramblicola TaxID=2849041 RepID=UPI001C2DACD2|nr:iron-containing redox enzyme family protein [Marinobacterium ramblicola]MBV1787990.1 iron-containing redox enzyme family protein [Marinobacterium ramblicola]
MGFFQRLQQETQPLRERLLNAPVIRACARGEVSLDTYIAFLTQAYHHVRHTVPLLMACGGRLGPEYEWLREAIAEYIEEELGHQEWILSDLAACGVDPDSVRNGQPSLSIELMVSYLYDCIQRGNPLGFFGMVQVLEGTSVSIATPLAKIIQQCLGLPDSAMRYLTSHGELDQDHIRFFEGLMDRVDGVEDQRAIIHSANVVYRLYGDMFMELPLPRTQAA